MRPNARKAYKLTKGGFKLAGYFSEIQIKYQNGIQ